MPRVKGDGRPSRGDKDLADFLSVRPEVVAENMEWARSGRAATVLRGYFKDWPTSRQERWAAIKQLDAARLSGVSEGTLNQVLRCLKP